MCTCFGQRGAWQPHHSQSLASMPVSVLCFTYSRNSSKTWPLDLQECLGSISLHQHIGTLVGGVLSSSLERPKKGYPKEYTPKWYKWLFAYMVLWQWGKFSHVLSCWRALSLSLSLFPPHATLLKHIEICSTRAPFKQNRSTYHVCPEATTTCFKRHIFDPPSNATWLLWQVAAKFTKPWKGCSKKNGAS